MRRSLAECSNRWRGRMHDGGGRAGGRKGHASTYHEPIDKRQQPRERRAGGSRQTQTDPTTDGRKEKVRSAFWPKTHLEMETGHDGQPLHGQLLGGLLVTVATAALDFGAASEVLGPREPAGASRKRGLEIAIPPSSKPDGRMRSSLMQD